MQDVTDIIELYDTGMYFVYLYLLLLILYLTDSFLIAHFTTITLIMTGHPKGAKKQLGSAGHPLIFPATYFAVVLGMKTNVKSYDYFPIRSKVSRMFFYLFLYY